MSNQKSKEAIDTEQKYRSAPLQFSPSQRINWGDSRSLVTEDELASEIKSIMPVSWTIIIARHLLSIFTITKKEKV